ncbi:MAG: PIN domain-containing protein [Actinomycetota bacterium]
MIFVDTSFWLAIENGRDRNHDDAARLMAALGTAQLHTTNHVRGETWTWLRRRAGHRGAVRFLDHLDASARVEVEHIGPRIESQAIAWLRSRDEREYSFVDATSFALMRSRKIREVLAFDGDFSAAGFIELRP